MEYLGSNSIILSYLDCFQQNLLVKCTFYCLTVLSYEISCKNLHALLKYKVTGGGVTFLFTPVIGIAC